MLTKPEVAGVSCNECCQWIRKEDWDFLEKPNGSGRRVPLIGRPPCQRCPKIPKDAPVRHMAYAVELSDKNRQAYWHYRQCKAVGRFPDDSIVARNAAIIADVLKQVDDLRLDRVFYLLGGKI